MRFTVTSTARNAEPYAARCVESVRRQTFDRWKHVYIDAASNDRTLKEALAARGDDPRVEVLSQDRSLLDNLLPIWRSLPDDEIIVWLDGDDQLAHDRALEVVADVYRHSDALVTYGQFMWSDGTLGFAAPVGDDPRNEPWRATHLKTFKAGLAKEIRDEDLRRPDGSYVDLAVDQAIMLPLLEMAGSRAKFIPKILYLYNSDHSFAANCTREEQARELAEVGRIRSLPRYSPL